MPYDQFSTYNYLGTIILGWRQFELLYSKEGACPFSKRNNKIKVKIHWRDSRIFFSRTTGPISTELGKNNHFVDFMSGYVPFQNKNNSDEAKINFEKILPPELQSQFQPNMSQIVLEWWECVWCDAMWTTGLLSLLLYLFFRFYSTFLWKLFKMTYSMWFFLLLRIFIQCE